MVRTGIAVLVVVVGLIISFQRSGDVDVKVVSPVTETSVVVPVANAVEAETAPGDLIRVDGG